MGEPDLVSTSDLAAWYGVTRAWVLKVMKSAGAEPVARGPRGVALWDRPDALAKVYYHTKRLGGKG